MRCSKCFLRLLLLVVRLIALVGNLCEDVEDHRVGFWSLECLRHFTVTNGFESASVILEPEQWTKSMAEGNDYFILEAKMFPSDDGTAEKWMNVSSYTAVQFGKSYATKWGQYRRLVRRFTFACFLPMTFAHAPPIRLLAAFASEGNFTIYARIASKNSHVNLLGHTLRREWHNNDVRMDPTAPLTDSSRDWHEMFFLSDADITKGSAYFQIKVKGNQTGRSLNAFLFPFDANPCVARYLPPGVRLPNGSFEDYACIPAAELTLCVDQHESANYNGFSTSVSRKATIPISLASNPPLRKGRWMALVRNADMEFGSEAVELAIGFNPALSERWPFWLVILLLFIIPAAYLLVFSVALLNTSKEAAAFRTILMAAREPLVPPLHPNASVTFTQIFEAESPFWKFLKRRFRENFVDGSYVSLCIIASSAFFLAALQLALSGWYDSQQTGSRDFCRYNYECYHAMFLDMPINNLISHIPYFVCGLVVLFLLLYIDYKMYIDVGSPALNLHVFYALGVSEIWEGIGSMVYHICPRTLGFQFDVAMMYVISILSVIGLADGEVCGRDVMSAPILFSLVVLPLWLATVIGTWYDVGVLTRKTKWIYIALVLLWGLGVLSKASILFQRAGSMPSRFSLLLLRCLVLSILLGALTKPASLPYSTGKMLLFASVAGMVVMTLYQLLHQPRGLKTPCRLRLLHAAFIATSFLAFGFFLYTPYRAGSSPWSSHNKNTPCILFGTFDYHDLWHILSAIMLALWTFVLLEIRMGNLLFKPEHNLESIPSTNSGYTSTEQGIEMQPKKTLSDASVSS